MQHKRSSAVVYNSVYCNTMPFLVDNQLVCLFAVSLLNPKIICRLPKTVIYPKIAFCLISSPRLFELKSERHNAPPRFPYVHARDKFCMLPWCILVVCLIRSVDCIILCNMLAFQLLTHSGK